MPAASEAFDPYCEWLGIGPHEQGSRGPDHYRLLGLARFEVDATKIAAMADERMALVRRFQVGPRGRLTQTLLNELSAAKACLLDPAAKAAYDAELSAAMSAALHPRHAVPPAVPPPVSRIAPAAAFAPSAVHPEPAASRWPTVLALAALSLAAMAAVLGWAVWRQRNEPAAVHTADSIPVQSDPPARAAELSADKPTVQLQEGSGEVTLSAATAQLAGGVELRHVGTTAVLGQWTAQDAAAQWRMRLIQPGFFEVELRYATTAEAAGAEITLSTGQSAKTIALRASGGLDRFISDTVTLAIPSGGQHDLSLALPQPLGGDWLLVETVRLIPVGGARPPANQPREN
jgi:hypothetical protein